MSISMQKLCLLNLGYFMTLFTFLTLNGKLPWRMDMEVYGNKRWCVVWSNIRTFFYRTKRKTMKVSLKVADLLTQILPNAKWRVTTVRQRSSVTKVINLQSLKLVYILLFILITSFNAERFVIKEMQLLYVN